MGTGFIRALKSIFYYKYISLPCPKKLCPQCADMGRHKVRHRSGTAPFFCGERADLGRHKNWRGPLPPTLRIRKITSRKKWRKNHVGGYFVKTVLSEGSRHLERVVPDAIFRVCAKMNILATHFRSRQTRRLGQAQDSKNPFAAYTPR